MASDDVIELGSSDEETEPAPKRRKPPPNAMVHIPGKLPPGVTVTPSKNAKSRINPANILKGSIGQAVTVTKITKTNVNPFANKKLNGNPIKIPNAIKPVAGVKRLQIPIIRGVNVPGTGISIVNAPKVMNPLSKGIQKACNINVSNQARGNNLNILKLVKPVMGRMPILKKAGLRNTNLPPGITIKRATPPFKGNKPKINAKNSNLPLTGLRMTKIASITQAGYSASQSCSEVPTVELDDDEPASGSGRQWYMRPEEQKKADDAKISDAEDPLAETSSPTETSKDIEIEIPAEKSQKPSPEKPLLATETSDLEKQNNKEPDKPSYIEITIEDSPIKPPKTKKGFKVGAELSITIEDSPVKDTTDKPDQNNSGDEETLSKDRNSKKKLEYPKTVESIQIVEVEFEPLPVEESAENNSSSPKESEKCQKSLTPPKESASTEKITVVPNSENKSEKSKRVLECIDIMEIEESPIKPFEEVKMTTPKKNKPTKPAYKMNEQIETIILDDKEKDEFTLTYQSFINLCFHLENSEDMKKIVEKKIKAYYRQVPKEYTESETFTDMVAGKIMAMKASPEKMYLYIKDVVDELNLQRKISKAQPAIEKEEQQKFLYGEDSEFDAKRQRQIRKLEKTLKKLHRAIQKLEEQEVDFDDEEDSVYLLTESEDDTSAKDSRPLNKDVLLQRYKERSVRVHAKLCQLTNTKMPSEARVQIDPRLGQPKGPAKRIEKWINRKVPIGTPLPFPDFHDVLRSVREANQEDKLGWNEADIMEEARDLFMRCGKKLQRRRQENEWRLAASRIPADTLDPAEDSTELKRKLEDNRRVAAKKETEVFNKYADRQNLLKLEAVEIGDKEAEESPVESDDEETIEVTDSLTSKQKRKERLKRLLQEKSKVSEDKGNQSPHLPTEGENSQEDATKDSNEAGISTQDEAGKEKKNPLELDITDKEPPKPDLSDKEGKNVVESDASSKSKDDSNKVDSDVDELHLLEKLYSDNEYNNSAVGSSDTESPIAISDTSSINDKTSSDERNTKKQSSDVISIENSSYSESEEKKEDASKETDAENVDRNNVHEKTVDVNMEIECVDGVEKKTTNEEYNGLLEDILLASSDEADDTEPRKENRANEPCINLKDDAISIGETIIIENRIIDDDSEGSKADNSDKHTITDGSSVEGMEIGPVEINSEDQSRVDKVEIASVESLVEDTITTVANTESPEASKERNAAEIINIDSVESIEDETGTTECTSKETRSVKLLDNVSDENTKGSKNTPVESTNDVNRNEVCENSAKAGEDETATLSNDDCSVPQKDINTTDNVDKRNECTTDEITESDKDNKTTKDDTIPSREDVSMDEAKDIVQTIENTDKDSEIIPDKETKVNNNSKPEAMEVDSLDETL